MIDSYLELFMFGFSSEEEMNQYQHEENINILKKKLVSRMRISIASFSFGSSEQDYSVHNIELNQLIGRLNIIASCKQISNVNIKINQFVLLKTFSCLQNNQNVNDKSYNEVNDNDDLYINIDIKQNKETIDYPLQKHTEVEINNISYICQNNNKPLETSFELDYNQLRNSILTIVIITKKRNESSNEKTLIGYCNILLQELLDNKDLKLSSMSSNSSNNVTPYKEITTYYNDLPVKSLSLNQYRIECKIDIKYIPNIHPISIGILTDNFVASSLALSYYQLLNPKKMNSSFHNIKAILISLKDSLVTSSEKFNQGNVSSLSLDFKTYFSEIRSLLALSADESIMCYHYSNKEELEMSQRLFCLIGISIINIIDKLDTELIINAVDIINLIEQREELTNEMIELSLYSKDSYNKELRKLNKEVCNHQGLIETMMTYYNKCFYLLDLFNRKIIQLSNTKSFTINKLFVSLFFKSEIYRLKVLSSLQRDNNVTISNTENKSNDILTCIFWDIEDFIYNQIIDNENISQTIKEIHSVILNNTNHSMYYDLELKDSFAFAFIKNLINGCINKKIQLDNPTILSSPIFSLIIQFISSELSQRDINKYPSALINLVFLFISSNKTTKCFTDIIIKKINAYDSSSVYFLIDYFNKLFTEYNQLSINQPPLNFDYFLLIEMLKIFMKIDNSLSLTKVIWFYYCNLHLMPQYHFIEFIQVILLPEFESYCFHWSWKVRKMFYMLLIFILNHKLKQYFNALTLKVNMINQLRRTYNKKGTEIIAQEKYDTLVKEIDSIYHTNIHISIKDYISVEKEYDDWINKMLKLNYIEYPIVLISLQKEDITENYN